MRMQRSSHAGVQERDASELCLLEFPRHGPGDSALVFPSQQVAIDGYCYRVLLGSMSPCSCSPLFM